MFRAKIGLKKSSIDSRQNSESKKKQLSYMYNAQHKTLKVKNHVDCIH